MKEEIDWKALALQLGTLKLEELGESGGYRYGQQAVELLLGEDNLRKAVDYYISGEPGFELARSVLSLIRPWSAMKHCYDIYKSDRDIEIRILSVELLRAVADERALSWINEFLEDEDMRIQGWGASVLEQLLYWSLVEADDAELLISKAERHANFNVQKQAKMMRELIDQRL